MSKSEEYAAFLEPLHLFSGISEDHLFDFADAFREVEYKAGDIILEEESQSLNFYLIYSGEVEISQEEKGQEKAVFVRGDYLGEESLVKYKRTSLIRAKDNVVLLELPASSFAEIPNALAFMRANLDASVACRQLIKEKHFDWVHDNEVIYFLTRKHPILFWRGIVPPVFLGFLGGILFLYWALDVTVSDTVWTIAIFLLVVALLWLIWKWLDWRNDYYIITNQRLIWLEKIIGIYDSRQEANLEEVLSVSINTDAITQSFFDYGKVSVKVMVGGIELDYTPRPDHAMHLLEELLDRRKIHAKEQTKEEIKQAIIDKLKNPDPASTKKKKIPPKKKTLREKLFPKTDSHILQQRFEEGGDIIYRKHWIVLFRQVAISLLVNLLFVLFLLNQLASFLSKTEGVPGASISVIAILLLASFISFCVVLYQYVDWSNDVFKVSKDKIFDIDRKPFGEEQSRSASLEEIESLEYKRQGFVSIFFNYGTVYIHIGAQNFEFEDVRDPASVQQDINQRYMEDRHKRESGKAKKDRSQMLDWLLAYNQGADEFLDLQAQLESQEDGEDDDNDGTEAEY
jgi:hypothetical protein